MKAKKSQSKTIPAETTIRMRDISRGAEKQLERLTPLHRCRIVDALERPVQAKLCQQIHSCAKWNVSHFAVGKLRVTFRVVNKRECVIHVGTHEAFDKFAAFYDGALPSERIPLEESTVMSQNKAAEPSQAQARAEVSELARAVSPTVDAGAHLLTTAVIGIFESAIAPVKSELQGDIETMAELVRGQVSLEITQTAERISQQELPARIERLQASVGNQLAELETKQGEMAAENAAQRSEIENTLRLSTETRSAADSLRDKLVTDVTPALETHQEQLDAMTAQLAAITQSVQQFQLSVEAVRSDFRTHHSPRATDSLLEVLKARIRTFLLRRKWAVKGASAIRACVQFGFRETHE